MLDALPYRGDGTGRPEGLALPPGPMPRRQGRRPLKRWRYVGAAGEQLVWNLVTGVHDAPSASEQTVWVDGDARAVGAVAFAPGLDGVGDLRFEAEAERVRRDDLLLLASDYRQPFGTFAGTLPEGTELRAGYGVMERHSARW